MAEKNGNVKWSALGRIVAIIVGTAVVMTTFYAWVETAKAASSSDDERQNAFIRENTEGRIRQEERDRYVFEALDEIKANVKEVLIRERRDR